MPDLSDPHGGQSTGQVQISDLKWHRTDSKISYKAACGPQCLFSGLFNKTDVCHRWYGSHMFTSHSVRYTLPWVQQGVGNTPQRIFISKYALLDWDHVTVEAILVQWAHCRVQETPSSPIRASVLQIVVTGMWKMDLTCSNTFTGCLSDVVWIGFFLWWMRLAALTVVSWITAWSL